MILSHGAWLLLVSLLWTFGLIAIGLRLLRARRHGVSLRMQVFMAITVTTLGLVSAFTVVVVDRFEARAVLFAQRAARGDAQVVARLAERSMELFGTSLAEGARSLRQTRVLYGFSEGPGDTRVQILDRHGQVLFDTLEGAVTERDQGARPEVLAALAGETDATARVVEGHSVATAEPIRNRGEVVGAVRVLMDARGMTAVLRDVGPKVGLLAGILIAAAALAGLLIGHSVGAPITRLTRAAERVARGERQATLPEPRGREVRALTAAFAHMRRELEQRDAVENLAADLSHELKNPVASLRAAAEVLEDAVERDPAVARGFARRIVQAAQRLDDLLKDLLALARLEAQGVQREAREDLAAICRAAIDEVADRAQEREVEIALVATEAALRCDASWLRRALGNLLHNALAFAPRGSRVRVLLEAEEAQWVIAVEDAGPGLEPALIPRAFERFVTTRRGEGGTGLGLAIARAVAEAHGGTARIAAPGPGGTRVELRLPRA